MQRCIPVQAGTGSAQANIPPQRSIRWLGNGLPSGQPQPAWCHGETGQHWDPALCRTEPDERPAQRYLWTANRVDRQCS